MPALSIIVFAFNEAENVTAVLDELTQWLRTHEPDFEIVFVDDGSSDATAAVARTALRPQEDQVLCHPHNRGIGAALKTGVAAARGEWVTFLPADGQVEPEAVGTLREGARQHAADVVFSIYADRDDGFDRKVLSWGVRALITLIHGVRLNSDGPYLFRRALFVPAELPPDTFFLNMEFPIRMIQAGVATAVVTVNCRPRRAGQSKSAKLAVIRAVAVDLLALRVRRTRERLGRRR